MAGPPALPIDALKATTGRRSLPRLLFLDADVHALYLDWESEAAQYVSSA